MRLTVLGGCGAWPTATQACGGYLLVHHGFRLLIDPGYAVLPRLLSVLPADRVDAVLVSHGHPDHCADLNPLLRARALSKDPPAPLDVYALPGALDAVLALDRPRLWRNACTQRDFTPGRRFEIGPFTVDSWALPHHVPNAGLRLTTDRRSLAYTGDSGPSPDLAVLARDADVFLAEATYPEQVPADDAPYLSSARQTGETAARAGVGRLLLTHLWPGSSSEAALRAARQSYGGGIEVATPGHTTTLL